MADKILDWQLFWIYCFECIPLSSAMLSVVTNEICQSVSLFKALSTYFFFFDVLQFQSDESQRETVFVFPAWNLMWSFNLMTHDLLLFWKMFRFYFYECFLLPILFIIFLRFLTVNVLNCKETDKPPDLKIKNIRGEAEERESEWADV